MAEASYAAIVLMHGSGQGVIVPLFTQWAGIRTAADWQRIGETFSLQDYEGLIPPELRAHLLFSVGGHEATYVLNGKTVENPTGPSSLVEAGEMKDWFALDRQQLLLEQVYREGECVAEISSGQDAKFASLFFQGIHPAALEGALSIPDYSIFYAEYPDDRLGDIPLAEFNFASPDVWVELRVR